MLRRYLLVVLFSFLLLGMAGEIRPVQAAPTPGATPLCLPGIYLSDPGDCLPAGPSSYLTGLAQSGMTLPLRPLGATPVDPALGAVQVRYGEVQNMPAPVFGSPEEAVKGNKKAAAARLDGNFVFISYDNEQEMGGKRLYQIGLGQWLTANYVSRLGVLPPSRGVTFQSPPPTAFGWVLNYFSPTPEIDVQQAPGYQNGVPTGRKLVLYDLVPVYGEQTVGEERWYRIGPDEWVPAKYISRVTPNPTPPAGVSGERWIEVNLQEQTLAVYDQRRLVFATIIASGADPFWTQPGAFQIYQKHEATPMQGAMGDRSEAYYLEDVPWTMYYDGPRALHGAYWRAKMGFPQSHGCVNLTVGDAHWLYNWGQIGDWVYVHDPSGQTPTDPSLYGSGGF